MTGLKLPDALGTTEFAIESHCQRGRCGRDRNTGLCVKDTQQEGRITRGCVQSWDGAGKGMVSGLRKIEMVVSLANESSLTTRTRPNRLTKLIREQKKDIYELA